MGTLNSYNFGTVEDTYKMFAPNRGFSRSANLMVSFKLTPNQPLLPWQPIVVIKHKISYNSACILYRRYVPDYCTNQGVFEDGEFNCVSEICLRPTPVAMATKI